MYEYISSLPNYNISTFMEDWYQAKNHHLRGKDCINWIQNNTNIRCDDITRCQFLRRCQRERGNERHDDMQINIDYKNIIVMDKLDGIHAFIFHPITQKNIGK
eukprot:297744_1